jgi:hypothetical protein
MSSVEPGSPAENLVRRVVRVLLNPLAAWDEIDAEDTTIEALYRSWVLPLAAIPAVCGAIGQLGFGGYRLFGIPFHRNVFSVLAEALVGYALTLGAVYVLALVIDELALQFAGERSRTQAFKLGGGGLSPVAGTGRTARGAGRALQPLPALPGPAEADALRPGADPAVLRPDPGGLRGARHADRTADQLLRRPDLDLLDLRP